MEDPGNPSDVLRRISSVAPLSETDAEQLHHLLNGVSAAAQRMRELVPVFPGEVNTSQLSLNVEGDDV